VTALQPQLHIGERDEEEKDLHTVKKFSKIIKDRNLYEDVLKEIKKAILSGTYPTGALLPSETELAKQFGVSRPVVREALRSLQSSGFVEIKRGIKGGAYVRDTLRLPLFDDFASFIRYRRFRVDHLAQARLLVEPEVCRLAAKNATPQKIREMKELVKHYSQIKNPDEKDPLYSLFHRLVGRSCGNPIYAVLIENIMDFTEGFIRTIKPVTQFIHEDHDHDEILIALENRDPERAAEVATQHARHILEGMRKLEAVYLELLEEEDEAHPEETIDAIVKADFSNQN
jgi:GntR family transcriptional repressor for pyruvate dehydrogenase complex